MAKITAKLPTTVAMAAMERASPSGMRVKSPKIPPMETTSTGSPVARGSVKSARMPEATAKTVARTFSSCLCPSPIRRMHSAPNQGSAIRSRVRVLSISTSQARKIAHIERAEPPADLHTQGDPHDGDDGVSHDDCERHALADGDLAVGVASRDQAQHCALDQNLERDHDLDEVARYHKPIESNAKHADHADECNRKG